MPLLDYWPSRENVLACVRADADAVAEQVMLAVHQPVPLVRHSVGSDRREAGGRQQLLDHFLCPDPEGGGCWCRSSAARASASRT